MQDKIRKLLLAAKAFYVDNSPIITDKEYDKLFNEVKTWEEVNNITDKLTNKVCLGYFEGDKTEKVKHDYPMLSVENANTRAIDKEVIITPKIDGVAIELVYIKGQLYRQLTRGDGEYGSDVTKVFIHSIPKSISTEYDKVIVRGEVTCPNYKEYGKSHRNVVAGSIGRVDFEEDRNLYFTPYWTNLSEVYEDYEDELEWLKKQGFTSIPYIRTNKPVSFTNNFIPNLPYPIDGYVIRYAKNKYYGEATSHHYKGIWCWKCYEDKAETKIIKVEWSKSKNSIWTPVAIIEPVELEESTVSRVNLMHYDYIREKDVAIGDTVLVHKARGIIPEIVEVVKRPKDRKQIYLLSCPDCGESLVSEGVHIKCPNSDCSKDKAIEFFCKVISIKGLALKNIEKLNINSPLDLYSFTQEQLKTKLGKIGEKIYKEIQESIKADVVKLIAALNPPKIKETYLIRIFDEFPNIEILGKKDKLIEIEGIADKRAESLTRWYEDKFKPLIPILVKIGFDLTPKVSKIKMELAVTGTFPMTRNEFISFMETKGVKVKNLTKKTKILIVGQKPSQTKIDKAKKYNIPVVPFSQFIKELNGTSS